MIRTKPIIAANAELFQSWADKISALIEQSHGQRLQRLVIDHMENDGDFAEAVNMLSGNPDDATKILEKWAKTNPVQAARLHKTLLQLPMTLKAMAVAIECIRETCLEPDSIDFESITYEEARDYCAAILEITG